MQADLLYREWEYRHRVFWTTFNLWGLIVGLAALGPFLKSDLLKFGWPVLAVPAAGVVIALFANIHLLGEGERMAAVARSMAPRPANPMFQDRALRLKHRLQLLSTAKVMANLFLYAFVPLCVSSMLILSITLWDRYGSPFAWTWAGGVRFAVFLVAAILPLLSVLLGSRAAVRAYRHENPHRFQAQTGSDTP
ncbi:hypothetical protein [uncultured Sphingomonas sp.]|uniref:hypothetical protein n=1 Tax=uncultured Sphingomonas sp. TaxID=158754 RepID=UPI00258EF8BE|nr:hypothetical protein [uncultured Sphingomonas sp.]